MIGGSSEGAEQFSYEHAKKIGGFTVNNSFEGFVRWINITIL